MHTFYISQHTFSKEKQEAEWRLIILDRERRSTSKQPGNYHGQESNSALLDHKH